MKKFFLLVGVIITCQISFAQLATRVVRDSLFIPWEIIYGPDNNIWFTQKNGYICRMNPSSGHIDTLCHETNCVVNNEGGMLGMALHPSFSTQPYVYVAYDYNSGSYKERIVRYTYSNNALQNPLILLDNINASSIHNGCRLLIVGDKLFISTGDASTSSVAQNVAALNGKIHRINLDGTIPPDNPIPNSSVWTWGHRNAQGMVYANGKIYSSEHGPNNDDELNIIKKGRNYGWPTVQGFCNTSAEITFCNDSNIVEPLIAWTPTLAVCGIDYYNQPMFPSLQNSLLMTTLKDQKLYQLKLNASFDSVISATAVSGVNFGRLRDICLSPDGKIYLSTSNSSASGTGAKIDQIIEIYDPSVNSMSHVQKTDDLIIYPNPAGDNIILKLPFAIDKAPMNYEMTNAEGKIVLKGVFKSQNEVLSIRHLSSGIYQIKVSTKEGKAYTVKMIKQ